MKKRTFKSTMKLIAAAALSVMVLMTAAIAFADEEVDIVGEVASDGLLITASANEGTTVTGITVADSNNGAISTGTLENTGDNTWQIMAYTFVSDDYIVTVATESGGSFSQVVSAEFPIISAKGALVYSNGYLTVSGFTAQTGAVLTASIDGGSYTSFDPASYSVSVSSGDIGDVYTLDIIAELDGATETASLSHTITLADYVDINGLEDYYALTISADSGVASIAMESNFYDYSNGYYFYSGGNSETAVGISAASYYDFVNAYINYGEVTISGSTVAIDFNSAKYGAENLYTLQIYTSYTTVGDTAASTYHTIRVYYGSGGSVSPSGSVEVIYGGNQSFIITPDSGYEISNVSVDGTDLGAISAYTFVDVDSDHTLVASFVAAGSSSSTSVPSISDSSYTTIPSTGAQALLSPAIIALGAGISLLAGSRRGRK